MIFQGDFDIWLVLGPVLGVISVILALWLLSGISLLTRVYH